jgi:transmembrane sensor
MLDSNDVYRIAQHASGTGTAAERAATAAWISADGERQVVATQFAQLLAASPKTIPASDTQAALSRFKRSIDGAAWVAPSRSSDIPHSRAGSGFRLAYRLLTSAAAAVVVTAGITRLLSLHHPANHTGRTFTSAIGERVSLTLLDGTQVVLAPASRLQVPQAYGSGARTVLLEGEANFHVVHDGRHPFTVKAANAVATDVGTTFDVRAYRDDPVVRVVVSDGQVSLSVAGLSRAEKLGPRDVGAVDRSGMARVTRSVDPDAFTAWTNGDLVYRDAPASVVIADLWRWYAIDVQAPDSALRRRVTMRFEHDESVSQVSDVLRGLLGPQVTIRALGDLNQASQEQSQSGGDGNAAR